MKKVILNTFEYGRGKIIDQNVAFLRFLKRSQQIIRLKIMLPSFGGFFIFIGTIFEIQQNKAMKKVLHVLLVVLILSSTVQAQNTPTNKKKKLPPHSGYFDLNLQMGVPMQEYSTATSSIPFGFSLSYLHQPSRYVPILIGGDFSYMSVGSKTINRNLTADITANGVLIDQLIIPLQFKINNNLLASHVKLRFLAPTKYVKPYIDGIGGFNYLWTGTEVFDRSNEQFFARNNNNDNGLISRKTQQQSFTYSAGVGGGIMFQLKPNMYLNLGVHYAFGGRASYYDNSQIQNWDIQLNTSGYNANQTSGTFKESDLYVDAIPKRSKTDMLLIQVGLSWNVIDGRY